MFSAASESAGSRPGHRRRAPGRRTLYAGSTAVPSTSTRPSFARREMGAPRELAVRCREAVHALPAFIDRRAIRSALSRLGVAASCSSYQSAACQNDPDDDRRVEATLRAQKRISPPPRRRSRRRIRVIRSSRFPKRAAELHPSVARRAPTCSRSAGSNRRWRGRDDGEHRQEVCAPAGDRTRRRVCAVDDPQSRRRSGAPCEGNVVADHALVRGRITNTTTGHAPRRADPRGSPCLGVTLRRRRPST